MKNAKVVGIVGSRRKKGNTSYVVESILKNIETSDVTCQLIYLGDYDISPCRGCNRCQQTGICILNDDMQKIYPLLLSADVLVLGSPTYFYNVSADVKLFFDRCFALEFFHKDDRSVWISANELLRNKFAVTVAICEQDNEKDMGITA